MNKLVLVVSVFAAVVILANDTVALVQPKTLRNSIFLSEPYQIVSKPEGRSLYSNLGNIAKRNCGGTGRVLQYRSEGCTTSSVGGQCMFPAERQFRAELNFIPSVNTESLGIRTIVTVPDGEKAAWQNPFASKDESIQAGKEYSFQTVGGVGAELRGKMITSRLEIYRESDKGIEACTEAQFLIV